MCMSTDISFEIKDSEVKVPNDILEETKKSVKKLETYFRNYNRYAITKAFKKTGYFFKHTGHDAKIFAKKNVKKVKNFFLYKKDDLDSEKYKYEWMSDYNEKYVNNHNDEIRNIVVKIHDYQVLFRGASGWENINKRYKICKKYVNDDKSKIFVTASTNGNNKKSIDEDLDGKENLCIENGDDNNVIKSLKNLSGQLVTFCGSNDVKTINKKRGIFLTSKNESATLTSRSKRKNKKNDSSISQKEKVAAKYTEWPNLSYPTDGVTPYTKLCVDCFNVMDKIYKRVRELIHLKKKSYKIYLESLKINDKLKNMYLIEEANAVMDFAKETKKMVGLIKKELIFFKEHDENSKLGKVAKEAYKKANKEKKFDLEMLRNKITSCELALDFFYISDIKSAKYADPQKTVSSLFSFPDLVERDINNAYFYVTAKNEKFDESISKLIKMLKNVTDKVQKFNEVFDVAFESVKQPNEKDREKMETKIRELHQKISSNNDNIFKILQKCWNKYNKIKDEMDKKSREVDRAKKIGEFLGTSFSFIATVAAMFG